jgi:hypothetical protein
VSYSVTLLYSATVTNRYCLAAEGKEVRICVLISLRCMMSSSPLRQSTRLLRGNAQGAAPGNVNTRRTQARQQPYPDESPRTAAARETRSRVAPENSRTTSVSTGAAASVSTVIPSPNTRAAARVAAASVSTLIPSPNTRGAAAGRARAPATTVITSPNTRSAAARTSFGAAGIPGPSAPDIPVGGGRRARAAPHASARRVATTTAAQAPAPAPGTAAVATARAYAGVGINAAPAAVMPANLGQDFVGEALLAQRGGGVAMQGGGATRRRQGKQGGQCNTVARSADKFAIQKCVKEYVFPKQKFVTDGDLDFSNNEMSICRCMAAALDVDNRNIENWWETARKTVKESIYRHRNNTIKKIKTVFQGKMVASVHFSHSILNF